MTQTLERTDTEVTIEPLFDIAVPCQMQNPDHHPEADVCPNMAEWLVIANCPNEHVQNIDLCDPCLQNLEKNAVGCATCYIRTGHWRAAWLITYIPRGR